MPASKLLAGGPTKAVRRNCLLGAQARGGCTRVVLYAGSSRNRLSDQIPGSSCSTGSRSRSPRRGSSSASLSPQSGCRLPRLAPVKSAPAAAAVAPAVAAPEVFRFGCTPARRPRARSCRAAVRPWSAASDAGRASPPRLERGRGPRRTSHRAVGCYRPRAAPPRPDPPEIRADNASLDPLPAPNAHSVGSGTDNGALERGGRRVSSYCLAALGVRRMWRGRWAGPLRGADQRPSPRPPFRRAPSRRPRCRDPDRHRPLSLAASAPPPATAAQPPRRRPRHARATGPRDRPPRATPQPGAIPQLAGQNA